MIERRIDELLSTLQCDLSLTVDLTGVFDPGRSFHGLAPSQAHVTLGFEQRHTSMSASFSLETLGTQSRATSD